MTAPVTLADIQAAERRIAGRVLRTPMLADPLETSANPHGDKPKKQGMCG